NGITNVWIGARTSVNPFAVQELAKSMCGGNFTVLVKNPIIPDLKLWIGNLERIEKIGVQKLFAIHRGFAENTENVLRNRPMWEIPIALRVARPDIPILCDPSHISGNTQYIKQIAQISIDYGFDGLMIETHYQPQSALSDASQQFTPAELTRLLSELIFKEHSNALPNELLRKPRTLIRNIDTQMGQLLAQRMKLIEEIAEIKQKNNLPLVQPEQWNQVVKTYQNAALKDELYQEFLQNFLNLLHQYSLQKQQKNQ
ncbi:MAG TPA: bifunctional 3-deoxy-7-phosphoheptulonate synthase/chorismate mutase type II, partial [Bacteroidales bacterium]|nr:bifunctional 3-deoxy-7-phosphoheptulonate synthase/chorismate mutase type II [Bacteroidales bacterium]